MNWKIKDTGSSDIFEIIKEHPCLKIQELFSETVFDLKTKKFVFLVTTTGFEPTTTSFVNKHSTI